MTPETASRAGADAATSAAGGGPRPLSALRALVHMRLQSLRNSVSNVHKDSAAKAGVVLFGLCNVVALGFWVSLKSFEFIEGFKAFADLGAKMVALLFLALLVLVVFSTVIIAYTTVFIAKETDFLFQNPVPPRTTLLVKILEAVSFSSWASLFLGLPVLVAYGVQQGSPPSYYVELVIVLPLFLLFAGLVGSSLALALAPAVRRLSPGMLLTLAAALLAVLTGVFLRSFDLGALEGENNLLVLDRFTSGLRAMHSPWSPSRWASTAVLAASEGNHREVLFNGLTLLANTLIFLPLLSLYGKRFYQREWLERQGSMAGRKSRRRGLGLSRLFGSGPIRVLAVKDVVVFLRSPAQLSQSLLFLLLMLIYSLSLLQIPEFFTENSRLRTFIYFANLACICMILSSFTSRFLFPLMSLEGKPFWVLGLAPMPRPRLVRQKALFGLCVSLPLGLTTIVLSNIALASSWDSFLGAVYLVILAAVCLSCLASGLGAAYPMFDEDNPARIAVGLGGTLNFFASALSVALLILIEATPWMVVAARPELLEFRGALVLASHGVALLFATTVSTLVLRLGGRALARRDF